MSHMVVDTLYRASFVMEDGEIEECYFLSPDDFRHYLSEITWLDDVREFSFGFLQGEVLYRYDN